MGPRKISFQDVSSDLFARTPDVPTAPDGFRYAADQLSQAAEQHFVAKFQTLPFKPFEFHGYPGNRRIVSYGYRYDYAGRALRASEAMPAFLAPLRKIASHFSGIPSEKLEQALITEYAPGAGIGWHRDKAMFEDVVALSFLAPCLLRLRLPDGTGWKRKSIDIMPRSGYLLHGAVRSEWEHSIVPMDVLRYSVTFRSFRSDWARARYLRVAARGHSTLVSRALQRFMLRGRDLACPGSPWKQQPIRKTSPDRQRRAVSNFGLEALEPISANHVLVVASPSNLRSSEGTSACPNSHFTCH